MPEINPKIIRGHVRLLVTVHRYGVDVVRVRIGENTTWTGLKIYNRGLVFNSQDVITAFWTVFFITACAN